jgi:plasmid stabilization system protein ParE
LAFLDAVDASLARIEAMPDSFPQNEFGIRSALLRRFPYAVLYRMASGRIEIVAVWHGHRAATPWRDRL